MEGWMNHFFKVINKVLSIVGGTALSLMMFMTVADVIMRAGGHPILGTYEMVALMLAIVIGFTIPMVSLARGHVYMEIILEKLSVRNKALMNTFTRILCFGLFAIITVLAFLYYTSVISWPIVYGGKPFNSFPSFIVVTIVLTIFTVTIASLATFSARSRLVPGRENTIFDHRATDDKFVIVVNTDILDNTKSEQIATLMKEQGAVEVLDKEFENIIE